MHRLTIVFLLCAIVSVVISRSSIPPCNVHCPNKCLNGYEGEFNQCASSCACTKTQRPQCGVPQCPANCRVDFVKQGDPCPGCVCTKAQKGKCIIRTCPKKCPKGFQSDARGCLICECKEGARRQRSSS